MQLPQTSHLNHVEISMMKAALLAEWPPMRWVKTMRGIKNDNAIIRFSIQTEYIHWAYNANHTCCLWQYLETCQMWLSSLDLILGDYRRFSWNITKMIRWSQHKFEWRFLKIENSGRKWLIKMIGYLYKVNWEINPGVRPTGLSLKTFISLVANMAS